MSGGTQVLRLATTLQAGRLLLHWGVEGGKGYKGGWRLPAANSRPEGTSQYKDRALQSPFAWVHGGLAGCGVVRAVAASSNWTPSGPRPRGLCSGAREAVLTTF